MSYRGDIALGATLNAKFTTVQATGAPTTLAGSPVISAYPDNSTTELTAGITLTVDFDSRTGLNNVAVVATGANGYLAGSNYDLIVTAGTVNSVSAVGYPAYQFSIQARPPQALATGETAALGIADAGTAQGGAATTITLAAAASATDHTYEGCSVVIVAGTGAKQAARPITGYVGSTKVATVDGWTIQPDNTSIYLVVQTPVGSVTNPPTALLSPGTGSGQVTLAAGVLTANANGDLTSTMKASVSTATLAAVMAESYAAAGATMTVAQALYMITQLLTQFAVSGTTVTVKKLDNSTPAATLTLDSATAPTTTHRAT